MAESTESPNPPTFAAGTSASSSAEGAAVPFYAHMAPRWAVIGIFLLLLLAAIASARALLIPLVLSILLALVFTPVRRFLERHGIPPGLSALFITLMLVAILVAAVFFLARPVRGWIDDAPSIGRQVERKLRGLLGSAEAVMDAGERVAEIASGEPEEEVQEVVVREPGLIVTLASSAPDVLAQAVFTLVLLFFLLSSGDMFYEKIVHVMPTLKDKRQAIRIVYDIERKLSRYLFAITCINAGLGAAIGAAMWLIGMPNPVLFGVIGFASNFVPYVGALFGVMIATVVGLVTFDEVGYALIPGAVYFVLTTIEGQLVTPFFVGRRLEMNTVVVFVSVTLWAWLWSVMGMILAVPLLVTVRAFCDHVPQLEPLGDFLSARGREVEDEQDAATAS